jgi:hypothetical protein
VVALLLAEAHGFFDGELVEGVHRVLDVCGFDGGLGAVDAGFDLEGDVRILSLGNVWREM